MCNVRNVKCNVQTRVLAVVALSASVRRFTAEITSERSNNGAVEMELLKYRPDSYIWIDAICINRKYPTLRGIISPFAYFVSYLLPKGILGVNSS